MKQKGIRPVPSGQEYLRRLGKYLALYLPAGQALDILDDYQQYFLLEKGTPAESMQRWGTPEQALYILLAENPEAKGRFIRRAFFWGLFLLLSILAAAYGRPGLFSALLLMPVCLLGLIRARGQLQVERRFPLQVAGKKPVFALHVLLPAAILALEAQMQGMVRNMERLPPYIGKFPIGRVIDGECAAIGLLAFCLLIWMLLCASALSVRYMGGVWHALGALLFTVDMRGCLRCFSGTPETGTMLFLFPLLYYILGVFFALLWEIWMKMQARG